MSKSMGAGYWRAWSAALLFFAAFYSIMIPLPLYLSQVGLRDWQIGIILGALGITSLVVRPLAGILADGVGRRSVMFLGTGALLVGATGVSFTEHPTILFGLRVLQATGYVAFTTAATALISDLAQPEKRASAMAVYGAAANVAITTVPAIVSGLLPIIQLTGAFWLAGALAVIGGGMVLGLRSGEQREQAESPPTSMGAIIGKLWWPATAALLFGMGFGAYFQFLPLLVERRALGSPGVVYTVYGISIILTRLVSGRFLDRTNPIRALFVSFLLLAAGLIGLALAESGLALGAAVVMIAAGSGVLHPLLITIHVKGVSASGRGRAAAVFYLGFDLGIGLGAWIFSPIFELYGVTGLYWVAAASAVLGIVPVWLMSAGQRQYAGPVET